LFCRKFMEACEATEHRHDSKQRHQVEGPIMQAKEWMREFGRCNLWSTQAQKSQREDDHAGGKSSQGGPEAPQASRPRPVGLPYISTLQCSSLVGKQLSQLSVCVLEVVVQNHLRLSHPSQACFAQQITPLIHSKSILRNNFCVLCYRLKPHDYIREESAAIMWKKTTSLFTKKKG
jgi:hypothetical protein